MGAPTSSIIKYRFVHNRDRKFGASLGYVPALIQNEGGDYYPALFTAEQIREAIARAKDNPEDAPTLSWWQRTWSEML